MEFAYATTLNDQKVGHRMDIKDKGLILLNMIKTYKNIFSAILLVLSGSALSYLLINAINSVNSSIDERDKRVISELHRSIEDLKASQIPSIEQKMYLLPEAVSVLSNLGVKVPVSAIIYLIFSYLAWLIFKKSYSRLEVIFYKWLDSNETK